jgi:hypothetical protein
MACKWRQLRKSVWRPKHCIFHRVNSLYILTLCSCLSPYFIFANIEIVCFFIAGIFEYLLLLNAGILKVKSSKVCTTSIAIYFPRRESTISCNGILFCWFYSNTTCVYKNTWEKFSLELTISQDFGLSATDLFLTIFSLLDSFLMSQLAVLRRSILIGLEGFNEFCMHFNHSIVILILYFDMI